MDADRRRFTAFVLGSALALGAVLGLVWAMLLRESATRRLDVEFAAYRVSAGLVEALAQNPDLNLSANSSVLGFGLYGARGVPLLVRGSAPQSLATPIPAIPSFEERAGGESFVLIRPLGSGDVYRGMPGMGMIRGRNRFFAPPSAPPSAPPVMPEGAREASPSEPPLGAPPSSAPLSGGEAAASAGRLPRVLWLEYSAKDVVRERRALVSLAVIVSLALAGLYALLLAFYRRNAELREREIRTRELVQLGEAARTLAHEIKNPLAVIRIQTAALRRRAEAEGTSNPAIDRTALVIEEEVDRLSRLSDRVRDFLKGGAGNPVDLALGPFLSEFAQRFGDAVELEPPPEGAQVRADPERLAQALDNLVANALEASSESGARAGERPRIALSRHGRSWAIAVLDRGPGVLPEHETRLFEPFFSTKERGSGIGLALARRIAEASGGGIDYHRRSGGGSVFTLWLPAERSSGR